MGDQFAEMELAQRFPIDYLSHMLTLDHSPVHSDPDVLGGTLVFRGTRVKAQTLLDYLGAGDTLESFLEDFPTVTRDDATIFLKLACEQGHTR